MEKPSLKRGICLLPVDNCEITRSVNIKLSLTEENLDYLLRQENALSQMCFKADQLTLHVLEHTDNMQSVRDPEKIYGAKNPKKIKNHISADDMDVEQESACSEYPMDQNKSDSVDLLVVKPLKELDYINTSHNEIIFLKEGFNEIKRKIVDTRVKNRNKNLSVICKEAENRKIIINLGRNPIVFKMLNVKSISTALKNYKTLNCGITNILQVKNSLQTFNHFELFENEVFSREMKYEIALLNSTGIYKSLICLIQSLALKKQVEKNEETKNNNSDQSLIENFKNDDFPSEKNWALVPIVSQNTIFLKSETMDIDIPTSEIPCDEIYPTVFTSPRIIELDHLNTSIENVIPAKSNLKRKIVNQTSNKKNKLQKSGLKFANVTTFYFERSQGFSSVPTKGGSTLGMANHHFYITTVPLEDYEQKKLENELPKRKTNNIFYRKTEKEKPKSVQALSLNQRIELLESADIQIEVKEEDDCAYIRSSRASAGCDCRDYCDPDICSCNLAGIQCQVDRPNFPCGCSKENCRNLMGRNEYNHSKVKLHFTKTIRKLKLETKGRLSKRKQASPSRVVINNLDNEMDVDMIDV